MKLSLPSWLGHPSTRGLDLDDPATTAARRTVVAGKPLLRDVYREWYDVIASSLPPEPGPVLEVGSGAGFLEEHIPDLLPPEVFLCPWVGLVLSGEALPFSDGTLRAIVMINVLHHLERPSFFLAEAARCFREGGVVSMIEPWNTPWSRWIHRLLHHEPFQVDAGWETVWTGPLSGGNGALPWILFERDRDRFLRFHPEWHLRCVQPVTPIRYLVAGGISGRSLAPGCTAGLWRRVERILSPLREFLGMFAHLVLERRSSPLCAARDEVAPAATEGARRSPARRPGTVPEPRSS